MTRTLYDRRDARQFVVRKQRYRPVCHEVADPAHETGSPTGLMYPQVAGVPRMRPAIEAELSVSLEVAHPPMNGLEALLKPCPKHPEMRQGEFPAGFPHDI
jgi:hypothetical protein